MRNTKASIINTGVIFLKYLLGITYVFASIVKIKGERFTTDSGALSPIKSAWHLFETLYSSGVYWVFIGISQFLAGTLLVTIRYSKLGGLIYLPIALNIFFITISYSFGLTPLISGLMLLSCVFIVIHDWQQSLKKMELPITVKKLFTSDENLIWVYLGVALFLFTFIYRFSNKLYDLIFWMKGCIVISILGILCFLFFNSKKAKSHN